MLVIKSQMKRSVRPLLSILFLMLVVAALSFRVPLRHGLFQLRNERPFVGMVNVPFINQALMKYASVDLSDPQLKKEVEALLEGRFSKQGRQRSFLSAGKYRIDSGADSESARGLRLPVQLQSPAYYKVWLGFRRNLRDWFRNRRYQADIMLELARLVEQLEGGKKMPMGKKYKSCAVVGNSGILLKSEYGGLIDSHEAVIRLNNARISGFEAKVGKRTTISFVNSHILHLCARRVDCFCHPYGTNVPTVMYICQPAHFLDYIACNSSEKAPWIVTDARFDVLCTRIVKYYSVKRFLEKTGKDLEQWLPAHEGPLFHYSSGMQAVMLAVGICDKVSIFGFGKSADSKHHYHTNQKGELSLHDYEAEYNLYTDLVTRPQAIPFISDKFKYPPVVMYR